MLFAFTVTLLVALLAAAFDTHRFRVPNWLTFPLCLSGLLFHWVTDGLAGLQYSAAGIAAGLLALMLFYAIGVMGAGDVKLLGAVGAWLGATTTLYVFGVAGVAAGIYSLVVLARQRRLREVPVMMQVAMIQMYTLGRHLAASDSVRVAAQHAERRGKVMPFASMIALGVLLMAAWELGSF